jgi:hypothetical protein
MAVEFNLFFRVLFERLMTISTIFPLDGHKTGEIPPVAWKQKAAINGAARSRLQSRLATNLSHLFHKFGNVEHIISPKWPTVRSNCQKQRKRSV